MSTYVIQSSVLTMSERTLATAAQEVAFVVGGQDEPSSVQAEHAIRQVMRRLNDRRWEYLSVRSDDIAIVDHRPLVEGQEGYQGRYTLPTPFRDLLSAKLKELPTDSGGFPLTLVNRTDYDRAVGEAGSLGSGTQFISFFGYGTTGQMELLEWPEAAKYLELRYYRPIEIPQSAEARLDLPADGPLESAVIHLAKEIVALDAGELRKAKYHGELGRIDLQAAYRTDMWRGEDDTEFAMPWQWARNRNAAKLYPGYGVMDDRWGSW